MPSTTTHPEGLPKKNKHTFLIILVIVLALMGGAGWWAYEYFFWTPVKAFDRAKTQSLDASSFEFTEAHENNSKISFFGFSFETKSKLNIEGKRKFNSGFFEPISFFTSLAMLQPIPVQFDETANFDGSESIDSVSASVKGQRVFMGDDAYFNFETLPTAFGSGNTGKWFKADTADQCKVTEDEYGKIKTEARKKTFVKDPVKVGKAKTDLGKARHYKADVDVKAVTELLNFVYDNVADTDCKPSLSQRESMQELSDGVSGKVNIFWGRNFLRYEFDTTGNMLVFTMTRKTTFTQKSFGKKVSVDAPSDAAAMPTDLETPAFFTLLGFGLTGDMGDEGPSSPPTEGPGGGGEVEPPLEPLPGPGY